MTGTEYLGPDSADPEAVVENVVALGISQRRRDIGQAVGVKHMGIAQQLAGECRDGDRRVLQALFALLRGDNNFLQSGRAVGFGRIEHLAIFRGDPHAVAPVSA